MSTQNKVEPTLEKKINYHKILLSLKERGSLSKRELSDICGLSRPTVDNIIKQFLENNLVQKDSRRVISKGRRPTLYKFNGAAKYIIGVDFEVPELNIILSNLNGHPISAKALKVPFKKDKDPRRVIKFVSEKIMDLVKKAGLTMNDLVGIGFGTPDFLKNDTVTIFSRNLPEWKKVPVKKILKETLKIPVFLDNDVSFMTLAENNYMKYNDENLIYVALRHGVDGEIKVGSGILIDGKIFRGSHGNAGWLGHIAIGLNEDNCGCGSKGCLEKILNKKLRSLEKDKELGHPEHLNRYEKMVNLSLSKDIMKLTEECLSIAISNLIMLFDPERIIINAEIFGDYEKSFVESCEKEIKRRLRGDLDREINIGMAQEKDFPCAKGAALFVIQDIFNSPQTLLEKLAYL